MHAQEEGTPAHKPGSHARAPSMPCLCCKSLCCVACAMKPDKPDAPTQAAPQPCWQSILSRAQTRALNPASKAVPPHRPSCRTPNMMSSIADACMHLSKAAQALPCTPAPHPCHTQPQTGNARPEQPHHKASALVAHASWHLPFRLKPRSLIRFTPLCHPKVKRPQMASAGAPGDPGPSRPSPLRFRPLALTRPRLRMHRRLRDLSGAAGHGVRAPGVAGGKLAWSVVHGLRGRARG